jgi:chemotaxis protein methyltransferase CheR
MSARAARGAAAPPSELTLAPLSDREFELFSDWIRKQAGIHLTPAKRPLLFARLGRRLRSLGIATFEEYFGYVTGASGSAERLHLLDAITTNETHFFRAPRQFEFLEREVFPGWQADAARQAGAAIRAWSAGCATGEEPFSLAMSLRHHFPPERGFRLELLASDLSTRALEQARDATWPITRAEEIPLAYRKAFMLRGTGSQQGRMRAGPELRRLVRFERINLSDARYPALGRFDLILCRNVLIYFDDATRAAVLDRLISRLAPGGYLLLGAAEGVRGLDRRVRSAAPSVYAASPEEPRE